LKVFDHIDLREVDRREIHLRLLVKAIIFVLAARFGLTMYPAVFAKPMTSTGPMFQIVFVGFYTLSVLLIAFLVAQHLLNQQAVPADCGEGKSNTGHLTPRCRFWRNGEATRRLGSRRQDS